MIRLQEIIGYLTYIFILSVTSLVVLRSGRPFKEYFRDQKKSLSYKNYIRIIIFGIVLTFNIGLVSLIRFIDYQRITIDTGTIIKTLEAIGSGITIGALGTIFTTGTEKNQNKSEDNKYE